MRLGSHRFNAFGKARNFAARGAFVPDTFGHAAHDFRLGAFERGSSNSLVAAGNCFFDTADESLDPRAAVFVDYRAAVSGAGTFFCLGRVSHVYNPVFFVLGDEAFLYIRNRAESTGMTLFIPELRGAFFGKGVHALGLVVGGKKRVENPPLVKQAFAQRCFVRTVD